MAQNKIFSSNCFEALKAISTFQVLSRHPGTSDGVKAALRDLGLKVHLKEEWKGEKLTIDKSDFRPTYD
jgi:hypothetical protein